MVTGRVTGLRISVSIRIRVMVTMLIPKPTSIMGMGIHTLDTAYVDVQKC